MKLLLLIALAGAIGTLTRYGCVRWLSPISASFPWGTLVVNVVGALIAGFCFVLCRAKFQLCDYLPVLFIGFLGALTTFSSFALESVRLLEAAQYGKCALNVLLQNVTGLLAAGAGMGLAKLLFR